MPAYNAGKFIKEAINSVINQSYRDWELVIIDDCSEDGTEEIIDTCDDSRIRVYRNSENLGAAASRNRGVAAAQGEYIAFLDADDCWDKSKLEKQAALNADFSFTGSGFIDENGDFLDYILHVPREIGFRKLLGQNVISNSSVLIRKKLLENYPFPENRRDIHEDYAVWLSILRSGAVAKGIDEPLLKYRVLDRSRSADKRNAAVMNWNVYRYLELSPLVCAVSELKYAINGINKWKQIRKAFKTKD